MNTKSIIALFLVALVSFFSCSKESNIEPVQPKGHYYQRTNLDGDFKREIYIKLDGTFESRNSRNEFQVGNHSKTTDQSDYILEIRQIRQGCENDWESENISELMDFSYYEEIGGFTLQECN
ncbi:hypothetical protein [Flammeovirga aprica]|uniref:Lipoprotein n=1 Tax=Flammeovirga aprica JL-4 TaxID=694437 RepID=A0A7X9XAT5_9BACT|nr:hypothetical protein [Flammeovirga aprica]NME70017.1 hypothetical protein [Flammeovirga aprica JL-4]